MRSGTNRKKATTKRGGDQVIDLAKVESSAEEGVTKKCKRSNDLAAGAKDELINLPGVLDKLVKKMGELEHEQEMQLTATVESAVAKAMAKFLPGIFAAMQKMQQQPDSVPSEKKDNKDNGDEDDSE
jgi:hypothetical protein